MSSTMIQRPFGGQERPFRLRVDQLIELEHQTDCGPQELARRLVQGTWRLNEVRLTVRLGLIGAGMEPKSAETLIAEHVDGQPLQPSADIAAAILWACLIGADAVDRLDKLEPEGEPDGPVA